MPHGPSGYNPILNEHAGKEQAICYVEDGFDYVWFPPPTARADQQVNLPTQWYDLNTRYFSRPICYFIFFPFVSGYGSGNPGGSSGLSLAIGIKYSGVGRGGR